MPRRHRLLALAALAALLTLAACGGDGNSEAAAQAEDKADITIDTPVTIDTDTEGLTVTLDDLTLDPEGDAQTRILSQGSTPLTLTVTVDYTDADGSADPAAIGLEFENESGEGIHGMPVDGIPLTVEPGEQTEIDVVFAIPGAAALLITGEDPPAINELVITNNGVEIAAVDA